MGEGGEVRNALCIAQCIAGFIFLHVGGALEDLGAFNDIRLGRHDDALRLLEIGKERRPSFLKLPQCIHAGRNSVDGRQRLLQFLLTAAIRGELVDAGFQKNALIGKFAGNNIAVFLRGTGEEFAHRGRQIAKSAQRLQNGIGNIHPPLKQARRIETGRTHGHDAEDEGNDEHHHLRLDANT
ncbi:hypothetical protein ACD589_30120 [Rhizobium sp. 814_E9_N1_1]|uniref:hypothetical protein n=1 Tax=Rhizobium sp. 814_E9_N1_1 TaxID=3276276 RepID=UPI003F1E4B39